MDTHTILFQRLNLLDEASEALTQMRLCDSSPTFADAFARSRLQLAAARDRLERARALELQPSAC
ncbi:hypothetical protein M2352_003266 [Azospirillum fermentarium]|uniref:hypothetical protein n=1 Tax=Azospirillum fermentarium TaxID=1233114 RepID=UPI0022275708|nr:hypothetical protein [Azospirillum fermentarium]MCW2247632.1 hypothetical protein [Azospirillum fermentarium]